MTRPELYVALPQEGDFGWGVVARGFMREFSRLIPTEAVSPSANRQETLRVDAPAFVCLKSADFEPVAPLLGSRSYAHAVFENLLTDISVRNAGQYDRILCASSWCRDRCLESGIPHADVLLQGIDPALFGPVPPREPRRGFVIFSGGKLEFRKGQDLVLKAMQILQARHDDILLVTSWVNLWPESMAPLQRSPYIRFDIAGKSWEEQMRRLYTVNDLDPSRIVTVPLVPNHRMRELFAQTDIGLFTNRCEGGTNLVMMEYMACGRPVIGTYATGHLDVLTPDNALLLRDLRPNRIVAGGTPIADWVEPSVEEIVAAVEYAYTHRDDMERLGARSAIDMQRFTWEQSARTALHLMGIA